MSTLAVNTITDASGGSTAQINGATPTIHNTMGRNRIINGDMRIDQRNAGAVKTVTDGLIVLDRWLHTSSAASAYSVQRVTDAPAGFTNSLKVTSLATTSVGTTGYYEIMQRIEGFNVADLGFGTANASSVTLSFWAKSSLTGTFGGALRNGAADRSYVFTYSISSANTWEYKTITVPGSTAGTWLTDNGQGMQVIFSLGMGSSYSGTAGSWTAAANGSATGAVSVVGTNGATFFMTGVQLEAGSIATPFERRPYGTELALCQRYYYRITPASGNRGRGSGYCTSTTVARVQTNFPVQMRSMPTALEQSGTATDYRVFGGGASATVCSSVPSFVSADYAYADTNFTVASGLTAWSSSGYGANSVSTAYLGWSAEL